MRTVTYDTNAKFKEQIMSTLINTEIKPFKANAYHNGEFIEVSSGDLKGKWSVVFFYPADFTFVCNPQFIII